MPLNKSTGNMYPWITHTWNPIRGRCPHECSYCYMKGKPVGELRFVESEMETIITWDKSIFVGSSIDMFANEIPDPWIAEVLRKCRRNPNLYFFQTKNPGRISYFMDAFPTDEVMLGTTIESNRDYPSVSKAPKIEDRVNWMEFIWHHDFPVMISIEPILDFDLESFVNLIKRCAPLFVSIGADSKNHHLMEPPAEKVLDLIEALKEITEIKIKDNLERIIGQRKPRVKKIDGDGII